MVNQEDINELRRIATNTYDGDKLFMNRLITKITNTNREILELRAKLEEKEKNG